MSRNNPSPLISALDRKLLRDLRQMPGQALAISAIMACGVAVLVMSLSTHRFLTNTRDAYYDKYRFGQIFAYVTRAPLPLGARLREIPGVAAVDLRVVNNVVLDVPGLDEPVIGRLVSMPANEEATLNLTYLRQGRRPDPLRPGEVLVSEAFALANELTPGMSLKAVINGTKQELAIVGIALSPEYVFNIRAGDMLPDDKRFGIVWVNETELAAAFNMEGAFNALSLTLMHGASEPFVIDAIDRLLKPYGSTGAYGRDQQVSARFLSEEIKQLRAMAFVAPSIFFGVGCFLLHVVISRLIGTQREQVAALKAFGYYNWEVGLHYLKFVLVISAIGCALGSMGGEYLAWGMSHLYAEFYRFPVYDYQIDLAVNFLGILLTLLIAIVATLGPVRMAVALPPAEAMRPAPPAKFRPLIIERIGLEGFFSPSGRMTMRELERRPIKAFFSAFGIACALAVVIQGNFGVDAVGYLIEFQFFITQRQDLTVTFVEERSPSAIHELEHFPGVRRVESFRGIPVQFRSGHLSHRGSIVGLGDQRKLYRLMDHQERLVPLPARGLTLGDKLAEMLDVRVGDDVIVEVLDRKQPTLTVPVVSIFTEYAGTNAYMHRDHLHGLLKEGPTSSGAYLAVDANQLPKLYRQLKETPGVAGVAIKSASIQSFNETIAENQFRMQGVILVFACIIAFGVVYNTVRISLAERSREFATLRVIGFTRSEVSRILLWELGILTLLAIPLGIAIGYGFCYAMVKGFETELFRIPLVISIQTIGFAVAVTVAAAVLSGLTVQRQVNQLDLIGVLKSKE